MCLGPPPFDNATASGMQGNYGDARHDSGQPDSGDLRSGSWTIYRKKLLGTLGSSESC